MDQTRIIKKRRNSFIFSFFGLLVWAISAHILIKKPAAMMDMVPLFYSLLGFFAFMLFGHFFLSTFLRRGRWQLFFLALAISTVAKLLELFLGQHMSLLLLHLHIMVNSAAGIFSLMALVSAFFAKKEFDIPKN